MARGGRLLQAINVREVAWWVGFAIHFVSCELRFITCGIKAS